MTETVEFWKGDFGKEYTTRNRPKWQDRVSFMTHILEQTGATSFLDVGTNAGWNLHALRSINAEYLMSGLDVNRGALEEATAAGFDVVEGRADQAAEMFGAGAAELVMTSGVLIHIAPADLPAAMQAIVDASSKYVLAVEYDAQEEAEVAYRGHVGRLWRRPFGKLYEAMGLSLIETGEAPGYDQCTYFLLEKS